MVKLHLPLLYLGVTIYVVQRSFILLNIISIYSELISQPSNYAAHNNPKSRISRLDWHVIKIQLYTVKIWSNVMSSLLVF